MLAVEIRAEPVFSAGRPRLLFDAPDLSREYDLAPDGEKFVMVQSADASIPPRYVLVQNWFEELKRLVPTDD